MLPFCCSSTKEKEVERRRGGSPIETGAEELNLMFCSGKDYRILISNLVFALLLEQEDA